jgi:hypothetical protein
LFSAADDFVRRRMQMAIVLGVGCNIVFALLRTFS